MNNRQAAWQHRNSDVDAENCFYDQTYTHANVLREGANRSRHRVNNTTIFFLITLILYALCWLF